MKGMNELKMVDFAVFFSFLGDVSSFRPKKKAHARRVRKASKKEEDPIKNC